MGALRNYTLRAAILAASVLSLSMGLTPVAGADSTRTFRPVDRTPRALVFAPRNVNPHSVRAAAVELRRAGGSKVRRVPVAKVRRAAAREAKLRVKSGGARGKLKVKLQIGTLLGASCEWGSFTPRRTPKACWRPYSDSSPFNVGVGSAPRVVSNSGSIVSRIQGFGQAGPRGGTMFTVGNADTASDYDHPLYYSQPGDPVYTVRCRKWVSSCSVEGLQVRIPAGARPAAGSDGHLGVIDQDSGWEYGFWETEARSPSGGTLWVGHGGRTRIGTPDSTGLGSPTMPNNVTAAHFGLAAGVIRPEELAAGQINHALFMSVKCTNGTFVWPARGPGVGRTCASMGLPSENAPALGQHFYLNMSETEINALAIPAWKKTILRAMARYGMFVGDTGSSYLGWSVMIQSSSSYTSFGLPDPWVALAQKYGLPPSSGGKYYFDLKDTIDWGSKLRVADPCVSRRAC